MEGRWVSTFRENVSGAHWGQSAVISSTVECRGESETRALLSFSWTILGGHWERAMSALEVPMLEMNGSWQELPTVKRTEHVHFCPFVLPTLNVPNEVKAALFFRHLPVLLSESCFTVTEVVCISIGQAGRSNFVQRNDWTIMIRGIPTPWVKVTLKVVFKWLFFIEFFVLDHVTGLIDWPT